MIDAERLLNDLNDEQREVAITLLGPVRVLAGAGTGKTRAITHRIAYGVATGVYEPQSVLALTFTTRAAGEMRTRLRELGVAPVSARTFHSAALAQLRYFWKQAIGGAMPGVLDSKADALAESAESLGLELTRTGLRDLAAEVEWRKVRNLTIDQYLATERAAPSGLERARVAELMLRYERVKERRRVLDMEDVLLATVGMLDNDPVVAEQVRAQYRVFVVDEYQDVSPVQQMLIETWLGARRDICVVGDASQTIYSFTGASSRYLKEFPQRFPATREIEMSVNYRSTEQIVTAANSLMMREPGAVSLRAFEKGPRVELKEFATDEDEAAAVAARIAAAIDRGVAPQRIAVLTRMVAQTPVLERALAARGVAHRLRDAPSFYARAEVAQALLMISAAAAMVTDASGTRPTVHVVGEILRELGYTDEAPEGAGADRDRWEALAALARLAEGMPPGSTIADFSNELQHRKRSGHEPEQRAVTISTIHAAKGLEWDFIFVVGLCNGTLPISYATTPEQLAEERRLLYVAITRARERLILTWPAQQGSRRVDRSPFLDQLRV